MFSVLFPFRVEVDSTGPFKKTGPLTKYWVDADFASTNNLKIEFKSCFNNKVRNINKIGRPFNPIKYIDKI